MIIKNKAIKNDNMDDDEGYVYVGSCSIPSRIVKLESITGKLFTYRTRIFQNNIVSLLWILVVMVNHQEGRSRSR